MLNTHHDDDDDDVRVANTHMWIYTQERKKIFTFTMGKKRRRFNVMFLEKFLSQTCNVYFS